MGNDTPRTINDIFEECRRKSIDISKRHGKPMSFVKRRIHQCVGRVKRENRRLIALPLLDKPLEFAIVSIRHWRIAAARITDFQILALMTNLAKPRQEIWRRQSAMVVNLG